MEKSTGSIEVAGSVTNQYTKSPGENYWMNKIEGSFDEKTPHLTPGIYKINGIGMSSTPIYTPQLMKDELVHFKDGVVADILEKTQNFFSDNTTKVYRNMKIAQQVGFFCMVLMVLVSPVQPSWQWMSLYSVMAVSVLMPQVSRYHSSRDVYRSSELTILKCRLSSS